MAGEYDDPKALAELEAAISGAQSGKVTEPGIPAKPVQEIAKPEEIPVKIQAPEAQVKVRIPVKEKFDPDQMSGESISETAEKKINEPAAPIETTSDAEAELAAIRNNIGFETHTKEKESEPSAPKKGFLAGIFGKKK